MTNFLNQLSTIFSTFGAIVFIPLILFAIAKVLGVTTKKAFNSALLCAVGLAGFNLVINAYMTIVAPVVSSMAENAGVSFEVLDTGWQSTSVIAYSTTVGVLFIGVCLVLELVLFVVKWTDVFMASDLWNNYSFMVWGSMLYALTGNMALSMILMIVQLLYILLFSEMMAKRWSGHYQYPQCCMTAPHHMETVPFAIVANWLLSKLGLDKIKINATDLQKKFGILGEPMFIGLVIGFMIGIIGELPLLGTLAGWGTVAAVAVNTAAVMAIFPKVGGIFASAFTALTEASKKSAAKSGEGRDWYLSVNDAAGYGEPNTLVTGILLIPIMLGLSFVLPGNTILPMADLIALPYCVETFVAVSHGNIVKSIIMGAIWFSIGMIMASALAPTFTEVAIGAGFQMPEAATQIVSFAIISRPVMIAMFYVAWKGGWIGIAGLVALYLVAYFLFKKNRYRLYDFLEKTSA